ncbi:MAG: MSHA biogenesis protein MshO [Paraglaciecola sp.]
MRPIPKHGGFTLVELVTVIIILGIVSIGVSGFIKSGVQIYHDVTERDQLLSESRFVVERLKRELRSALPNSVRVAKTSATQCIQFVPIRWATYYTTLPVLPATDTQVNVVDITDASGQFLLQDGDFAVVYPTSDADVYDTGHNKRHPITQCTLSSCIIAPGDANLSRFTVDSGFADISPASRLYIVREAISYCVTGNKIYRQQDLITPVQPLLSSGVLMAQHLSNNLSSSAELPFTVNVPTLNRNALVQVFLAFENNDEIVNYSQDIHIPNAP